MIKTCVSCRLSKKKCTREHPICGRCNKNDLICSYNTKEEALMLKRQESWNDSIKIAKMVKRMNMLEWMTGLLIRERRRKRNNGPKETYIIDDGYKKERGVRKEWNFTVKAIKKKNIKDLLDEYIKEAMLSFNQPLIINILKRIQSYEMRLTKKMNHKTLKSVLFELFLNHHLSFYPFITRHRIEFEMRKENKVEGHNSILLTVILLKVLRHLQFIYFRGQGYIKWDIQSSQVCINRQAKEYILLKKDPLYMIIKNRMKIENTITLDNLFSFKDNDKDIYKLNQNLAYLQTNLLLSYIEHSQGLITESKLRLIICYKLIQILKLDELKGYISSTLISFELLIEMKLLYDTLIIFEFEFGFVLYLPVQRNINLNNENQEIILEYRKGLELLDEQEVMFNQMLLNFKLLNGLYLLKETNQLNQKYRLKQLALQQYELETNNLLDKNFNLFNDIELSITNHKNHIYKNQLVGCLLIKNIIIIYLMDFLLETFIINNMTNINLEFYKYHYLSSALNLIQSIFGNADIPISNITPTISYSNNYLETFDWSITIALFHSIRVLFQCKKLNFIKLNLQILVVPLINCYHQNVIQYAYCFNYINFSLFDEWYLQFLKRDKQKKISSENLKN
ncbi:hypothetical protein K502DRAFT_346109 [Neoconidiobolus thromboides FSU 785]|nr:hypothetical protein K502DRAFT_346109 [Neoconidiobolus thromboides FSU 785]